MDTPSTSIGPGLGAFVAFFVLAVALWLLMRNMNGRMRRIAYREQQRVAELQAREAARPPKPAKRKRRSPEQEAGPAPETQAEPRTGQDEDRTDPAP